MKCKTFIILIGYLFGNKHDKSKEIGEKIYRLTKNYFHIRDIKKLKAQTTKNTKI